MSLRKMAAIAALALGGLAQATPAIQTERAPEIQVKQEHKRQTVKTKQSKEIIPDGFGGIDIRIPDMGTPPKYYGQHLQRIGKQKWNKKR
jgi:hypothetical protein